MEKNFRFQNADIHYKVEGKGKPVLLLHGFGEDSSIWKTQVEFLKSHCTLIIPDLPGSGKSDILAKNEISIEDLADCMYEIVQLEQAIPITVLGHSMGGYVTLAMAEKFPDIIDGIGLIHSTAFADSEEKKSVRKRGIEMMRNYGTYAFLKNTIPNLFSNNFKKKSEDIINTLIEAGNSFSLDALIQYYTAMMNRPDRTQTLKNTRAPVLFVIGTEDVAAPLTDLEKQIHLPQTSYIHIMENVGHMSMLEASEELNRYMLQFINR